MAIDEDDKERCMPQIMLSPYEVGERLGVSEQTVVKAIKAGTLPAYKIGRRWRVDQIDLENYIAARRYEKKEASE